MSKWPFSGRVGEIRPSQFMFSYGVGASVDLPQMTVLVMGLDDWPLSQMGQNEIAEERLRLAARQATGAPIERLLLPPPRSDSEHTFFGNPDDKVGIPVAPFPRWMRCPRCNRLAGIAGGEFEFKPDSFRPDRARFIHTNCRVSKQFAPTALPARFLVACEDGHVDDFPWVDYAHSGVPCAAPQLELYEIGTAGDAASINVKCLNCGKSNSMVSAFAPEFGSPDKRGGYNVSCGGFSPHLRQRIEGCEKPVKTILLGASNSWFPITLSAFSIPGAADPLGQLVEGAWETLKNATSVEIIKAFRTIGQLNALAAHADEEVFAAVEKHRAGLDAQETAGADLLDLKTPEWAVFSNPDSAPESDDFKLRRGKAPQDFEAFFEDTVLVERLREVHTLLGFTRIDSPDDLDMAGGTRERWAPLSRDDKTLHWLPAVEVRGEGLFLRLKEDKIADWMAGAGVSDFNTKWQNANAHWRAARGLAPPEAAPGPVWARYLLLHSLSHALMRQLCLECGYAGASVRERIYWQERDETEGKDAMAGILLYTAAPDAEGTLGGLVALGEPESLGYHLRAAFEELRICASDPICSEHRPGGDGAELHGSACHACLFAPETSCERGNKFLERGVLVPTFDPQITPFFPARD